MSDIYGDVSEVKTKTTGVVANKVARFSYNDAAYTSDDVAGVVSYDYEADQNVPAISAVDLNPTVIDKGLRSQAVSLPRNAINHFFGRVSYNLNKINDFFNLFLASFLRSEAMNGNRYTATTPYLTGDSCTQLDSTGALRIFQRISTTPAELIGSIPLVADVLNDVHWKELVTQLSDASPVMNGTAAPGDNPKASRDDHIHPSDTSRAPNDHASTATTYGRSSVTNYGHSMASGATPLAPAVTALVGTDNGKFAREGHVHPTNFTATATDIKMNGVQAVGTLVTFARADHVHPTDTSRAPTDHSSTGTGYGIATATEYGHAQASEATPLMNGAAAVGTDNGMFAREAHVHPVDTSRLAVSAYLPYNIALNARASFFKGPGSFTWTKPSGCDKIVVFLCGAGGGGGGYGSSDGDSGGGGGGPAYRIMHRDVAAISSIAIVLGAGGAGGAVNANGAAGGTTTFDSFSVSGGGGGISGNAGNGANAGGAGGAVSGTNAAYTVVATVAGGAGGGGLDTSTSTDSAGGGGAPGVAGATGAAGGAGAGPVYIAVPQFGIVMGRGGDASNLVLPTSLDSLVSCGGGGGGGSAHATGKGSDAFVCILELFV